MQNFPILDMPPTLRSQLDYIYIFKESEMINRKCFYDYYVNMFSDYETFRDYFKKCTKSTNTSIIPCGSMEHEFEKLYNLIISYITQPPNTIMIHQLLQSPLFRGSPPRKLKLI